MAIAAKSSPPRLIAFPKGNIPYNDCLYAAVEALGIRVIAGHWAGRWLLKNLRAGDVAHIHWPSFLYYEPQSRRKTYFNLLRFIVFLEMIRWRNVRIAWTAHNLYPHDGGRKLLSHRIARFVIARRADVVMAHGPTSAAIVAKEFAIPADKMRIIKHGHWIDYHRRSTSASVARELLKVDADCFVYVFVGACKPYKNLEILIESFARLTDNSVLVIAGYFPSETYRQHIEALLKRLPTRRWRLHSGFIADEDVHRYVLAGNVLVLPYAEILTSGSAMLGLSFGRPVIAPNAGGLRDMVTAGCGFLYEPAQANGLFDALQRIRTMQFSEEQIVLHALSFTWTEAAMAIANLLGA